MPNIALQHNVNGVLTDAVSIVLQDASGTFAIRRTSSGTVVLAPPVAVVRSSVGAYSYDVSGLTGDTYEAVWKIEYPTGHFTYQSQTFQVDADITYPGVRLMDVEQLLAERCGPYYREASGPSSTTGLVQIPTLASSIDSGEFSDLYVLRRGRDDAGGAIVGVTTDDRIRQISEVNLAQGQFVVDRPYAVAPASGEIIELLALHPERELRRAVKAGLKRCYLLDRLAVAAVGTAVEVDLTAAASWLLLPSSVHGVKSTQAAFTLPQRLPWFGAYAKGGHTWLALAGYAPLGLLVTAKRQAHTLVNGATSQLGPDDDDDQLAVDAEYAAAAGHVELWRIAPRVLLPGAQVGLQLSRKDVADEFTKITNARIPPQSRELRFGEPVGYPAGSTVQVGW